MFLHSERMKGWSWNFTKGMSYCRHQFLNQCSYYLVFTKTDFYSFISFQFLFLHMNILKKISYWFLWPPPYPHFTLKNIKQQCNSLYNKSEFEGYLKRKYYSYIELTLYEIWNLNHCIIDSCLSFAGFQLQTPSLGYTDLSSSKSWTEFMELSWSWEACVIGF